MEIRPVEAERTRPSIEREPGIECRKIEQRVQELTGPALLHVVRGRLLARFDDDLVELADGDLLRVAPGATARVGGRGAQAEVIVLQAGADWAARAWSFTGSSGEMPSAFVGVDRASTDRARRAARSLRTALVPAVGDAPSAGVRGFALRLDLVSIALEAPSLIAPRSAGVGARSRSAFLRLLPSLDARELDELSLPALARELGLSARQVARLFERELGHGFREHVTRLRIERAKHLLATTTLRVIDVAAATGWSSLAHFHETFRRRTGTTPSGWRASHGVGAGERAH